jgi:hypothetical protein
MFWIGVPVAWMLVSNGTTNTIAFFVGWVRDASPVVQLAVIMTDRDCTQMNALRLVYPDSQMLLCKLLCSDPTPTFSLTSTSFYTAPETWDTPPPSPTLISEFSSHQQKGTWLQLPYYALLCLIELIRQNKA